MYRFYILSAVCWFAFQATFYGKYARQLNGMSIVFVRNVSLIGIWTIALIRVDAHEYAIVSTYRAPIMRAALCGTIHLVLNYEAYKHVPIWITGILKKWTATITWFMLWYFFLWETFSLLQYSVISVIILASLYIARQKNTHTHLQNAHHRKWMGYIFISGILSSVAWYLFKQYSAEMNPFLASYVLEASVGVVSLIVIPCFAYVSKKPILFKRSVLPPIFLLSVVAIMSTIFYTYALKIGSFSLSNALSLCSLPLVCLFSYLLYKEKMTKKQIIATVVVVLFLVILKYIS